MPRKTTTPRRAAARRQVVPTGRPRARSYAVIPREPPKWGWPGRIQLRTVNVIVGHEGIGKGILGSDLTSRFSRGDVMPDGSETCFDGPVTVMLITPEDDPTNQQGYRLVAANADLENVVDFSAGFHIAQLTPQERAAGIDPCADLRAELDAINAEPGRPNVGVIWIDPLSARVRINRASPILRAEVLEPLEAVARDYDLAIITLVHDTKNGRAAGAKAITEAARVVLTVERIVLESGDTRLVKTTKANNTADNLAPIAYTVDGVEVEGVSVGKVRYMPIPDDALALTVGPVAIKDKIVAILRACPSAMHYTEIREILRDGRPAIMEGDRILCPAIEPDDDFAEDRGLGRVRTALTRLKADPASGVISAGNRTGRWTLAGREPGIVSGVWTGEVAGLPGTAGGPSEDAHQQADPLADHCDGCLRDECVREGFTCTATPAGVPCACQHNRRVPTVEELQDRTRRLADELRSLAEN